jgi:hypothetical protein
MVREVYILECKNSNLKNLWFLQLPLRDNQRIVSVQLKITYVIDIYVKTLLVYCMEDTKPNKRFMVELSTWWLRTKSSDKDKKAISSANFAISKNFKPGIY